MEVFGVAALLAVMIFCYLMNRAYQNTKKVVVNHIDVTGMAKGTNQHEVSVLHLSDLHLEHISISPDRLFDLLSRERIDLIALTGDFLDRKRTIPKLTGYLDILKQLNPKYGIYVVFGNHDYVLTHRNLARLKLLFEEYGCKVLQNEHETISIQGRRLNLIGIDDFSTKRSDLNESYKGLKDGYNLVLTHDPNIVLKMEHYHFDYLLAGHFHGGQIYWPKPYHLVKMGKLVRMNMVKGLHLYQGKWLYISEGLGQTGVNIRIGSRPEITLHRLCVETLATGNETILAV